MRTKKAFSTISYNSIEFLEYQLKQLIPSKIQFYCWIKHYGEGLDSKDHIHLFIIPNDTIDTIQFQDYMREPIPNNEPLGCIFCTSSKFDDFFLYTLHNVNYLISKGQERQYHYDITDFHYSNYHYFSELVTNVDYSKINSAQKLKLALESSKDLGELLLSGFFPIQQANALKIIYENTRHLLNKKVQNGDK